jgi:transposase InsO family protein
VGPEFKAALHIGAVAFIHRFESSLNGSVHFKLRVRWRAETAGLPESGYSWQSGCAALPTAKLKNLFLSLGDCLRTSGPANECRLPTKAKVWIGDIAYIATDAAWLFLAVVIDLFSRQVVGWYNRTRLHSTLAHVSPMKFEQNWLANQSKQANA